MKSNFTKTIVVLSAITILVVVSKCLIAGKEVQVLYITYQDNTSIDINYKGGLYVFDWFIVSSDKQKDILVKAGYFLPDVNFENNNLIVSRFKISKLYRSIGNNPDLGIPDGRAVFDKRNSSYGCYYLYLMPKIMLSQGVG